MRKLVLITVIIATGFTLKAQNNTVQNYINQYKDIAITEMVRTGVPASITLAQGILESGCGNSRLAKYANNHFGIKCKKEWTGKTFYQDDDSKSECFRVYKTAEDSYRDHSDFLRNRPYYTSLFALNPTDYKAWANGLKKAGYAREPDYPKNLIGLIEKYNLEQYSDEALAKIRKGKTNQDYIATTSSPASGNTIASTQNGNKNIALFDDSSDPLLAAKDKSNTGSRTNNTSTANNNSDYSLNKNASTLTANMYPTGVFKINKTKVIYATKGSSLFALASTQKMSYNKLLDYNDLNAGTDILSKDRLVYLEKKPKKGDKNIHIVSTGESLDEIAQKEGIQLNRLAEYNHIEISAVPLPGESLYLRAKAPNAPRLATARNIAMQ